MNTHLWSERLGKNKLQAQQLSKRGDGIICEMQGDRVLLSGKAAPYLTGIINLPIFATNINVSFQFGLTNEEV